MSTGSQYPTRPSVDSSSVLSPIISPSASYVDLTAYNPPSSRNASFNRSKRTRRESVASSIVSFNSSVGTIVDWKVPKDYGNYAISTLLDNPSSRSLPPRPTTRDIPPVHLSPIPKVKSSEFAQYLTISAEYEKYLRAKELGLEDFGRIGNRNDSPLLTPTPSFVDLVESKLLGHVRSGGDVSIDPRPLPSQISTPHRRVPSTGTSANASPSRKRRTESMTMTPLTTVPAVYFDENFHLENPRTFDIVSERSDVIRQPGTSGDDSGASSASSGVTSSGNSYTIGRKALATNAILQEKLSWYMDTVEMHLTSSISSASSSFFAALGDLRQFHSETATAVKKIQSLRGELTRLDEDQAVKGLEIVRLQRRRSNVGKLEASVQQMENIMECVKEVERALEKGQVEGALDGVDSAENLLVGKLPLVPIASDKGGPLMDLRRVKALDQTRKDLYHLRHRVGKVFESQFVDALLSDLRRHVEKVPSNDTLRRWSQSFQREQGRPRSLILSPAPNGMHPPRSSSLLPEYAILTESFRQMLSRHLDGLQRARFLNNAIAAYRDAVLRETKSLIRRNMPSDDDDSSVTSNMTLRSRGGRTAQEKSVKLASALRNLGPIEAEDMLFRCFCGISELVRRLGVQQKLLLDLTSGMGEDGAGVAEMLSPRLQSNGFVNGPYPGAKGHTGDPMLEDSLGSGISDLISPALDLAQTNLLKIIRARNDLTVRFNDVEFLRYFTLNKLFGAECEAVSGRMGPNSLQTYVGSQIKDFLANYHRERTRRLTEVIEKDKWGAKDFDEKSQARLGRILEAATRDPESWLRHGKIFEDTRAEGIIITADLEATTNGAADSGAAAKTRPAVVDEQRYILPESSLVVLAEIERYEGLIVMMPGVTGEISSNIIDFLKLFNSRACQLILGAGATKSAGLKNITTKHLALASQGLSIIIALIPYIRECARRHAGSSAANVVAEFDRVKRTYQEHQSEIHNKLISIMSDRLSTHIRNFPSISWSQDLDKPNTYMETLCKETTTLHKVLSKHLPESTLLSIMDPVFNIYMEKLVDAYRGLEINSEDEKKKMIRDVEFFIEKLGKLEGNIGTGRDEQMLEAVRGKTMRGSGGSAAAAAGRGEGTL